MQLHLRQLSGHLKNALLPVYLISGEVPLLMQEARDAIRAAARQAGYQAHERLDVEPGFNWLRLTEAACNLSLFDDKTFIELHNPSAKFDATAAKILLAYLESPPPDKILLITTSKLTAAQQKTRWHQMIAAHGAVLPIWPVKSAELPAWIQGRLQSASLKADSAAIRLLAEYTEGNLLATQQALLKLRLLYPQQLIGVKEMAEAVSDSAQFNVFELSQMILQNNARGVVRVLTHLRAQDTEPTLVLWLLSRECRELINMMEQLRQGKNMNAVLAAQWSSLKALYQNALPRLNLPKLKASLTACHEADKIIKGVSPGNAWDALTRISLNLAGSI